MADAPPMKTSRVMKIQDILRSEAAKRSDAALKEEGAKFCMDWLNARSKNGKKKNRTKQEPDKITQSKGTCVFSLFCSFNFQLILDTSRT